MNHKPLILTIADNIELNDMQTHMIRKKYIDAVQNIANVTPIILPGMPQLDIKNILELIDGILLTGAISNIHPKYYNSEQEPKLPIDTERDEASFNLIKYAIQKSIPILAICRGMQELNIALGGTLETDIQDKNNNMDHRAERENNPDKEFALKHDIIIKQNSLLQKITSSYCAKVNSLHSQAIKDLAKDLTIDAVAEDGIIEAISLKNSSFTLGVQFHPEYWAHSDEFSKSIFVAFGNAVRLYNIEKNKND